MSHATNLDIMQIESAPDYDLLYTDPPWGNRMVKFFETMERKATGKSHNNSLQLVIEKLGDLADPNKPLIIEYGIKGWEEIIPWLEAKGHRLYKKFEAIQSMKRPFVVLVFNTQFDINTQLVGFNIVTDTVLRTGAKKVFDPFGGIGQTARAVHKAGADYYGNEMNPERFRRLKQVCDVKKA